MTDTGGIIMFIFENSVLGRQVYSTTDGQGNTKVSYEPELFGTPKLLLQKLVQPESLRVVEIYTDIPELLENNELGKYVHERNIGMHNCQQYISNVEMKG